MNKQDFVKGLNKLLDIYRYKDYGPNGLQVDGAGEVKRLLLLLVQQLRV